MAHTYHRDGGEDKVRKLPYYKWCTEDSTLCVQKVRLSAQFTWLSGDTPGWFVIASSNVHMPPAVYAHPVLYYVVTVCLAGTGTSLNATSCGWR